MAPPPSTPHRYTHQLCFLLPLLLVSGAGISADAVSTSYSSHCPSPAPAPDRHTDASDAVELLEHFRFSPGFFSSSGARNLFIANTGSYFFSFLPHVVSRTADPALLHITATFTLFGHRVEEHNTSRGSYGRMYDVAISFHLDGYYSSTTSQLCMVGSGTEAADTDGPVKHYADVAVRLRVPSHLGLTDPFVAGRIEGADFETISLVTYAEGDVYEHSERASCPPAAAVATPRRALQPQHGGFSCASLRAQLVSKYRLKYGSRHPPSNSSLPQLHEPVMIVNQVRLYAVFSNDMILWSPTNHFLVEEQAVVAEGFWDSESETSQICIHPCLVHRSRSASDWSSATENLEVRQCGIGMSFWFPAVWTIRDRSATFAMLWDASQVASGDNSHAAGVIPNPITASSFRYINRTTTTNLSDVEYNYNQTFLEIETRHHLKAGLRMSNHGKKIKVSFPCNYNYSSYSDLEFKFLADNDEMVRGYAYPISIGSAISLQLNIRSPRHAAAEMEQSRLVNVSYVILFPFAITDWPSCSEIKAEGVYDTKTGFLSMLGCRELNVSTDCRVIITVQFTSFEESQGIWHGEGRISSLRNNTDVLYFGTRNITLYGMYSEQVPESIWRMDLESFMTLASTTLSCAFTVLQILHTKRNRNVAPATSITTLVVLALGHATPLALHLHTLLANRGNQFVQLSGNALLELNELVLRAPALIASVLQLRLLQLAWSGRRSSDHRRSAAERSVLRVCLSLYLIGAAVTCVAHAEYNRAAREDPLYVHFGREPGTLLEALASYAGLVTDTFLLPQVVLNAVSESSAKALSPLFYVGGTVIRVAPHVYDAFKARRYVPSVRPSYVYASPLRDGLFGSVVWDVVVTCVAASLALLLLAAAAWRRLLPALEEQIRWLRDGLSTRLALLARSYEGNRS